MADWLDDEVPIEWLADLLDLIRRTPNLDWLLLTKRPENFKVRLGAITTTNDELAAWLLPWILGPGEFVGGAFDGLKTEPPHNVWIGTTVEDQTRADERIPQLLQIPAVVRFLSCEPLLGPVDLRFSCAGMHRGIGSPDCPREPHHHHDYKCVGRNIHWVIAGGESGHGARPMHPDWARSLRDQCTAAGVPFLFKQWGEWCPASDSHGFTGSVMPDSGFMQCGKRVSWIGWDGKLACPSAIGLSDPIMAIAKVGKKAAGRLLDGREHNGFPEVAR